MRSSKEILDFLCRRWEKKYEKWKKTLLREKRINEELPWRHITDIAVNGYPSMAFEKRFHNKRKGKIYGSVRVKFFDDDMWYSFYIRRPQLSIVNGGRNYTIVDINSDGDVYDAVLRRFLEIAKTDDVNLHAQSFIDAEESLEEILVKMDLENV